MSAARIVFIGGLLSYRALFNWLNPWIFIPTLVLLPIFQILLFAFMGRQANLESDQFFVIGNAVQSASTPCLWGMTSAIAGERSSRTLGLLLASPAPRVATFVGRAIPVIANAWIVSLISFAVGAWLLRVDLPPSRWPAIAVLVLVGSVSCTGLALVLAAISLRVRDTATLANSMYGVLLIFCGVNVPLAALPGWMPAVSAWLPLTRTIEATREVAAGASLGHVGGLVLHELALTSGYLLLGICILRYFEASSRAKATLEVV
ncbi:hypothetical protein GCM10029976_032530 [Kribbella albertanoniae]|uniref:Transport permease protein n=1 Tax=Kribbella albertanoniae TaxID=1266829 RepID=A0A4R4QJN3_9ACTN|nr:ABC transporter permease [Kribbella albertanoniae]TDC35523.1 ABC transporter permease [Kribbella albertanoniae]